MASSVHEKADIDAEDMPPVEDVPDYDDLIESALDALDVYQARRADMNLHLKKAFFNLAQAKLALGPARVGPASYHLGRVEPLLTVDITSTMDGLYAYNLVVSNPARKAEVQSSLKSKESSKGKESSKSKESIKGATVDLRYDASTSAVKLEELSNEKSQGSKMRRRMQKLSKHDKEVASSPLYSSSAGGASDEEKDTNQHGASSDAGAQADTITPTLQAEEDEPPTYSDSVNEYLLDPMQQFSAFPPVTLRKAQAEFKQSLRLAMALLSEQQRFGGMSTAATQNSVRGHSREKT